MKSELCIRQEVYAGLQMKCGTSICGACTILNLSQMMATLTSLGFDQAVEKMTKSHDPQVQAVDLQHVKEILEELLGTRAQANR
mmetsp:Transcript_58362/g.121928  ORF Transcript_58362/g.121928 Transcript_58362/m.121928 type:complete len:84 (+) Transcript_58362:67-318(+)